MEVPPPEAPFFINNKFNPSWFEAWSQTLTLQECDNRYFKRSGGVISGSVQILQDLSINGRSSAQFVECESTVATAITNSSTCDSYGLHLHSILSGSTGLTPGTSIAFNNSLTDNVPLANICLDKIGPSDGNLIISTRTGSTCDERIRISDIGLISTGSVISNRIGTDSIVTLALITDNQDRILINNSGNIGIAKSPNNSYRVDVNGSLNASDNISAANIGIGNALPTTLTRDLTIMESTAEPRIIMGRAESNNNAFTIAYRHNSNGNVLNRLVIEAFGQSNQVSITANGRVGIGSPTPTQPLEVLGNINISNGSSYMIGGTSIDSRYVRLTGATMTGQLYISTGVNTSVPANRRYGWFGTDPSNQGGGSVNIALRAGNDCWIEGSLYCSSDKRLKYDIVYPKLNSMALLNINPAFYTWKKNDERCFGLIAQDLIKAGLGILVNTFEDKKITEACEETNTEAGYCHTVEYSKIPLLLIDLCKRLDERISNLEEQQKSIQDLETKVNALIDLLPKTKKATFNS